MEMIVARNRPVEKSGIDRSNANASLFNRTVALLRSPRGPDVDIEMCRLRKTLSS
jgi:hypothetical protein